MEIIFATKNKNKIKEIQSIMKDTPFKILSMEDVKVDIDIIEDGITYEENSIKKAIEVSNVTGKIVLADDSGFEVDFLDKAPGVYSSRYLGEDTPYAVKNAEILKLLKDVPFEKRTARFVCVISAVIPQTESEPIIFTEKATLEGYVANEIAGEEGFGYDPIMYIPEFDVTAAQMNMEQKNKISHRGKALIQMKDKLVDFFHI